MEEPLFEQRPWGNFEIISRFTIEDPADHQAEIKVKKIIVKPGNKLSYQSHQKREEIWYIASGTASVVLNDISSELKQGETIFVPKQAKHRIGNSSQRDLIFIEIAKGICEENDIVRYEDDYRR